MQCEYILDSQAATARLGQALAQAVLAVNPGAFLLYGGLGAGKTTLVRHMVEHLPGGPEAEVSSPSFTICNIYSTKPEVRHFDLYRLEPQASEGGFADNSLEESLDDSRILTIVEWAERLSLGSLPPDGVICRIETRAADDTDSPDQTRDIQFLPLGPQGERFLRVAASLF